MDLEEDYSDTTDEIDGPGAQPSTEDSDTPPADKAQVQKLIRTIKENKKHHQKAFKRMRRDMRVATWGRDTNWPEDNYTANIVGRHIKMKTAALYAKNPKAVAKRRETLDFKVWDGNPASLQVAYQTAQQVQMMQTAAAMQPPQVDPMTGEMIPAGPAQLPPGAMEAQALLADFQEGMQRRMFLDKYGKTLEILFSYYLKELKPLDFKRGMKKVVRRALTTCVGYVELGFQREYGPRPGLSEELADFQARLEHINRLAKDAAEGEIEQDDPEMAELEHAIAQLQAEPEILIREGLVIDFLPSTHVIPDKLCKYLDGFVGARNLTLEYLYTPDEVEEKFGIDLDGQYTSYTCGTGSTRTLSENDVMDDDYEWSEPSTKKNGLVCVWKHYDRASGLVYYLADGYSGYLREPAGPDVYVEDFWPVYALTFNEVENEDELFPPSDVTLLLDMQNEHNRSRQGKREHRDAARPRWVYANGVFGDEEDTLVLRNLKAFEAAGLNIDSQTEIKKVLQTLPVPGVDPNLYDTNEVFTDMQLVGGAQEANYGAVAKATATESAIAANATTASDGSAIDDLDSFLTTIARASGQILQREMSAEKVMEIVGPGAVWPDMSLSEIASEVALEVEAGSTGKPNQAVEINNWKQMAPILLQMPSIDPTWLAKEMLRRLDDRMDLTDAVVSGIPSIVAQNQMQQPNAAAAENDPNAQGAQGANNSPQPEQTGGSDAAFGSNQV